MPGPKRHRRERTEEWASIKQWTLWPEQELYEAIRPLVLFHETAGERAKEIDVQERTLARKADEFERSGMATLIPMASSAAERICAWMPPTVRTASTSRSFGMGSRRAWRASRRLHAISQVNDLIRMPAPP